MNIVEGVYGIKPKLSAVGGNEGVAVVTGIGSGANSLSVGDWVIPFRAGFGTWRNEAVAPASELVKVANDMDPTYASILTINSSTAYCLLRDFVHLHAGVSILEAR